MTILEAVELLIVHFAPEERSVPDSDDYKGRCASVIKAINGALQEFYGSGPSWKRKGTRGALLHAPVTVQATVTHGSQSIAFGNAWQSWFSGCTVSISGATTDNELLESDAANTLLLPHDGPTGTVSVVVLGDCVNLAPDVQTILAPVQIVNGPQLSPVPNKGLLQLRNPAETDYGHHLLVPCARMTSTRKSLSTGTPQLYCVDTEVIDPYASPVLRLRVSPAPNSEIQITHEARLKVPRFTTDDIEGSTFPNIPVPHDFAESILLPIATKRLMESPFFRHGPHTDEIARQYEIARQQLEPMAPQSRPAATIRPMF